jgi:hypothetical protein
MQLEERGVINFDSRLGELMPFFIAGSNKENIRLQDMLTSLWTVKSLVTFLCTHYRQGYKKTFSAILSVNAR